MSVLGTFSSFGIARLAIYASSSALNVTGNNIANINTDGYCRQYLSTSPMYVGGVDQLASGGSLNFGTGVSSDAIYQYRDIYMDIRYRDMATYVGEEETKLSGLSDLANVLDEVASGEADFGIIEAQFSEIVEMLQNLSTYTGSEEYDTLVRSACETLAQLFNSYAEQLDNIETNQLSSYNSDIDATNLMLTGIRELNEQIRNAGIYGDEALALRDMRNLLIDELSGMIGIDVIYSEEDIGMGLIVENLTINIAGTDTALVDGLFCTQLTMEEMVEMPNPEIYPDGSSYFQYDRLTSYMYVDLDGNPTNYADQSKPWLNPYYPDNSDAAWLDKNGNPVYDARLAGPQPNEYYTGFKGYPDFDSTGSNYPVEAPESILVGQAPVNEDGGWMGGQFAVGVIDDETGTWKLNADGSVYVAYTTNNPEYATSYEIDNPDYDADKLAAAEAVAAGGNPLTTPNYDEDYDITTPATLEVVESVVQMNNNVQDGNDNDNTYLITLTAMKDAKGNYMKDLSNREITADILLSDIVISGALQGHREMLTGEGEYSSKLEISMNPDATTTRGIPYYQMALDSLAQKFAEVFNSLNTLNPDDIFAVDDDGNFYDCNKPIYDPPVDYTADPVLDPADDAILQLDSNGNPMYEIMYATITLSDGTVETVKVNTSNMYDLDYTDEPAMTLYEKYIYASDADGDYGGVRHPNFMMDSDGHFLHEVERDGVLYYEPIQLLENGALMMDSYGNPVYMTAATLTPENYDILLNGYPNDEYPVLDLDGNQVYNTDEDGNYVYKLEEGTEVGESGYAQYENGDGEVVVRFNDNAYWDVETGERIDTTVEDWDLEYGIRVPTMVSCDGVITQEIYDPAAMYDYDEKNDCFLDKNGSPITNEAGDEITYDMAMKNYSDWEILQDSGVLTPEYANFQKAGTLISNNGNTNDSSGITASNISISRDWSIGEVRIITAKGESPGTTDNSNVLKFITAMDADMQYDAKDVSTDAWTGKNEFFNGSFQGMLVNTTSTLAQDIQTTTTLLVNYDSSALALDNNRLSVSGVDLNDEATNMMTYQKAYVAAAKLMTTLDEVLEVLLNM
ncbi:MAG: flagellar basal body rod C-terminal domain-containing protein [Eubacteriales bacterium]